MIFFLCFNSAEGFSDEIDIRFHRIIWHVHCEIHTSIVLDRVMIY